MSVLSDGSLSLVSIIKKIKADKKFFFEEGNPYYILVDKTKGLFYILSYSLKDQKELEIKEGIPFHVYNTGLVPMYYHILIGYKPHRQIIDNVIKNIVSNYQSMFNFTLRANNFIKELSFFLSKEILGKKGLTYAVLAFVLKLNNFEEASLNLIEPDGGIIEDIPFFLGGMLDRDTVLQNINKKETIKEKLLSAYHEIFIRTNDHLGITITEIDINKATLKKITKTDLENKI